MQFDSCDLPPSELETSGRIYDDFPLVLKCE
jgi:hypothetical protein